MLINLLIASTILFANPVEQSNIKLTYDEHIITYKRPSNNITVLEPMVTVVSNSSNDDIVRSSRIVETDLGKEQTKDYARLQVVKIWNQENWEAFETIIQKESGWQVGRRNGSGCAGLGQACPASKLGNSLGDPKGEVDWFIKYCQRRYGNPQKALAFWNSNKWW
jgi:hypothetical protein